jgi:hypothetical protein
MAMNRLAAGWIMAAGLIPFTGLTAAEEEKASPGEPLTLEATVVRGDEVSRLSVFVRNQTERPISFDTGARGGAGSLDDSVLIPGGDRHRTLVIGTAPTVVPVFRFDLSIGEIALQPPRISGPTSRAMRPQILTIPANSRVPYASFAVPNAQIAGRFVECEMIIRGEKSPPEPDVVGPWEMRLVTKELREVAEEE